MKIKQFIGPFNSGPLNLGLNSSNKIVQIGVERPHSIPISEEGTQSIIFSINNGGEQISCSIGERDILEFENLYADNFSITVEELTNPYLIIDIAYE